MYHCIEALSSRRVPGPDTPDGLDFDIVLEAKGKDLALLRLREQLNPTGLLRTEQAEGY